MSGLEVSEIRLRTIYENIGFRIDSQFYTVKLFFNKNLKYEKLGIVSLKHSMEFQ